MPDQPSPDQTFPNQPPPAPLPPEPPKQDQTAYVENDSDLWSTILDSIADNACVLFLGPVFGVDDTGKKINEQLWDNFNARGPKIDDDFQNLFITKEKYPTVAMANRIKTFYLSKLSQVSIYKDLAKINFSAYVVFGQDRYLTTSFDDQHLEHHFLYYSPRWPQGRVPTDKVMETPANGDLKNPDTPPIIFNVYGNIMDPQSVITDYDTFYNFLFSIMGEGSFFPAALRQKMATAQIFLLLGFDLKRWYVPLLIARFYNIGNVVNKPMVAAAMNDTDATNNEEYVKWLGRYPLQIDKIKDSGQFIKKIVEAQNTRKDLFRAPKDLSPGKESDEKEYCRHPGFMAKKADWYARTSNIAHPEEMIALLDEISGFFGQAGFPRSQDFVNTQRGALWKAMADAAAFLMLPDEFGTLLAKVRNNMLKYINCQP